MERRCEIERSTLETRIKLKLNIDGNGNYEIKTGIPFFDHMLAQLAKHGSLDLFINAQGDLDVDFHHTVEDVGIVLGQAFKKALGEGVGIQRFGSALIPMDDALSRVVVDISGRPYLYTDLPFSNERVGNFPTELIEEFLRAFSVHGQLTLHAELLHGRNTHHQVEAVFKALGQSLKMAVQKSGLEQIPSTKGVL
ncbi:imidazoleglycerol-phosphate dehydratase [Anoxybacter fermentans]|uniref:Imidazoleglycerol-phosphate dehydratase n=1 Tax=Anoxybacter fermentans TaxID=1323375 RepID=A0A3Q9HRN7_9FIRM|nr:imidazoleglycerol-phosphate dehydratase HisB [Anoxybacter fermentans]AZR74030.1 imidazoleglycerol-phosphate dehydratase [Anoxybacter fermentans]